MDYLKLFCCQLLLLAFGAEMSFLFDRSIGPPFTRVDLLACVLAIPFFYFYWAGIKKVHTHFSGISLAAKVLLAIPAFAAGTFTAGWINYLFWGV